MEVRKEVVLPTGRSGPLFHEYEALLPGKKVGIINIMDEIFVITKDEK